MTRDSRIICGLYLTVTSWLAFCTINTHTTAPAWTTITMAAASAVPILGIIRELDLRDARRALAVTREREARRAAWADEAVAQQAASAVGDACCERWWTSLATDHDTTCPTQQPRSSAA
jgi:hypothetical protein